MRTVNQELIYQSLKITEETKVPMFIFGNPGAGKTTTVNDFRLENGYELTELRVQNSPEDIFGFDVNEEGKNCLTKKYPRWMMKILEDDKAGKKHILFIDEITTANMYVQAAMFQLIFNRGIEDIKLPDSCLIVAAGNYKANLSEEFELLSPTLNRFCLVNLENGLTDDDITNYINRTLSVGKNNEVIKKSKSKSKNNRFEDLLISAEGLENEKAIAIKNFLNDVMEDSPEFFDVDNKDFTWLKDVQGEMYGVMSPRTISYLSLVLKNMIDRDTFSLKHVLGLIGFGTGPEICLDKSKLNSLHTSIKRSFSNNIIEFKKNIAAKCGSDIINKEINEVLKTISEMAIIKDGNYSEENNKEALKGELIGKALVTSKKDKAARTLVEYFADIFEDISNKVENIPNDMVGPVLDKNKNFETVKSIMPRFLFDQLLCLEEIVKHAQNKIINSKTDIPNSRKKIEKIKKTAYNGLLKSYTVLSSSKYFNCDNSYNNEIKEKLENIDSIITQLNIELDKF